MTLDGDIPDEVVVDGRLDQDGLIEFLGTAQRVKGDMFVCLANCGGALCRVEVTIRPEPPLLWQGDNA